MTAMTGTASIFSRSTVGFGRKNLRKLVVAEDEEAPRETSFPQNTEVLWAGPAFSYTFAFACIVIATILRAGFDWLDPGQRLLFAPYYLSVLVVSSVCGALPGMVTAVVSLIVVWAAFVSPSYGLPSEDLLLRFGLFFVVALLTVWIAWCYRSLIQRLRTEQKERTVLVKELHHRGKNIFAVIQAIANQTLSGQDKNGFMERVSALAATDELIINSGSKGVDLKDLAAAELEAYGEERVSMQGGSVALSPALARTMSLALHELATNAAKYGALSIADGRVSVSWKVDSGIVKVIWRESGGPVVLPPTRHGFGLGLIGTLTRTCGGQGESDFRPEGVIHEMSFVLN
jgi:two-component sensor histidine kinase